MTCGRIGEKGREREGGGGGVLKGVFNIILDREYSIDLYLSKYMNFETSPAINKPYY